MSSTTPATRGGDGNDVFPTDERITLDFLRRAGDAVLPPGRWVEPAVGDGAIVRAVEKWRPRQQRWAVCDIRDDAPGLREGTADTASRVSYALDWTKQLPTKQLPVDAYGTDAAFSDASVYLTNPPFALAEEFARKCFARGGPCATTALLLRLNFFGSFDRMDFWNEVPAPDVYTIVPRPSFGVNKAGKKGTDSCEYGWFVWGPASTGRLHLPALPWKPRER